MLDVTGAGAAAVSTADWYDVWKRSPEAAQLQVQIEKMHEHGRTRSQELSIRHSVFATSWLHQFVALTRRNFQAYWRNPTYIHAKFLLNIAGGLLVGFAFFQANDSLQGTQSKLFVSVSIKTLRFIPFSRPLVNLPGPHRLRFPRPSAHGRLRRHSHSIRNT